MNCLFFAFLYPPSAGRETFCRVSLPPSGGEYELSVFSRVSIRSVNVLVNIDTSYNGFVTRNGKVFYVISPAFGGNTKNQTLPCGGGAKQA